MAISILNSTSFDTLFVFDTETSESKNVKIKWTDHPIEAGQNVSDYGWIDVDTFEVSGHVTAWPYDKADANKGSKTTTAIDPQRPSAALSSVEKLAKQKQPVTVSCLYWLEEAVIEGVNAVLEGQLLKVSITLRKVFVPNAKFTQIPQSRLKGSGGAGSGSGKPDNGSSGTPSPKKKGGKQTGKKKTAKDKKRPDVAQKVIDKLNPKAGDELNRKHGGRR